MEPYKMVKVVAVSGFFDPLHVGHIEYFKMAKGLGDRLIVVLNNDEQLLLKRGKSGFMNQSERKKVIEGGPCIIIATSGMLIGGASVEYLRNFADNAHNGLCLSCYQPPGGLGRQLQDGKLKEAKFNVDGKEEIVPIKLKFLSIEGFSGHSSRNELMAFVSNISPKPRRVIINHGEQSRSIDLASSLHKSQRIETIVPRNLEAIRLR